MNQHNDIPELSVLGPDCHSEWTDLYHLDRLCERCQITIAQLEESTGWENRYDGDPITDHVKMLWTDEKGPTIRDIRGAAHRGCHFCTKVISTLLLERRNGRLVHFEAHRYPKIHENDRVQLKAERWSATNRTDFRLSGRIRIWIADGDRCDPSMKEQRSLESRLIRRKTDYGWSSLIREYYYDLMTFDLECRTFTDTISTTSSPSPEAPAALFLADHPSEDSEQIPPIDSVFTTVLDEGLDLYLDMSAEVIAGRWLRYCLQNHDCGPQNTTDPILPLRVVDVRGQNGSNIPFLLQTHHQRAKYATLSYTWGNSRQLKTTKNTIEERHHSIPMNHMPKTFRDAVNLTRELGIQYLWIDSLCILQDSEEDCMRELASMADIYANSTLTIAAVGSLHSDDGCAPDRNKLAMSDCRVGKYTISYDSFDGQSSLLSRGSIHQRAWCFQETEISPRMLSVGLNELYWQCKRGLRRESEPNVLVHAYSHGFYSMDRYGATRYSQNWPSRNRFFDGSKLPDPLQAYSRWYWLLEQYVGRKMTFPRDKLPAISALAVKFLDIFESVEDRPRSEDYCCGIWRQDLLPGILWYRLQFARQDPVRPFRGPSWSWAASYLDNLGFLFSAYPRPECCFHTTVMDVSIEHVSQIALFGGVRSGKLTLYGPVASLPEACYVGEEDLERSVSAHSESEHDDLDSEEILDRHPVSKSAQVGTSSMVVSPVNGTDLSDLGPRLEQDEEDGKSPKQTAESPDITGKDSEFSPKYDSIHRSSRLKRSEPRTKVTFKGTLEWSIDWDDDDSPKTDCHMLRITDESFLVIQPVRKPGTVGTAKGCKDGIYRRVGLLQMGQYLMGPPKKSREEDFEGWEHYERILEMRNALHWKEEIVTII